MKKIKPNKQKTLNLLIAFILLTLAFADTMSIASNSLKFGKLYIDTIETNFSGYKDMYTATDNMPLPGMGVSAPDYWKRAKKACVASGKRLPNYIEIREINDKCHKGGHFTNSEYEKICIKFFQNRYWSSTEQENGYAWTNWGSAPASKNDKTIKALCVK